MGILEIRFVSRSDWGISSAGRAPDLHSGGQRFDPAILHQLGFAYVVLYKLVICDYQQLI